MVKRANQGNQGIDYERNRSRRKEQLKPGGEKKKHRLQKIWPQIEVGPKKKGEEVGKRE